jgi:hypothetical protein
MENLSRNFQQDDMLLIFPWETRWQLAKEVIKQLRQET